MKERKKEKQLSLINEDAARLFIEIDDTIEAQTGESMLGKAKPFLISILEETQDSTIPGAFSAVLNQRLTGKTRSTVGK